MSETWSEIANREDQYLTIQRKDKIVPFRIANSLGGRNNSSRLDKNTYRKKERLQMTNGGIWQDEVREN